MLIKQFFWTISDLLKKVLGNNYAYSLSKLNTKLVFKLDGVRLCLKDIDISLLQHKFVVFNLEDSDYPREDTYTIKRLLSELSMYEKYTGVDFKDAFIDVAYSRRLALSNDKPFTLSGDTLIFNLTKRQ